MKPRKVLVVDDSEITLVIVASVLEHAGYDVRTTSVVTNLRAALGDWRPELILTDVNMPDLSGPELCRRLKASYETADVPVVLYSALPEGELEQLAETCEAEGYLCKADIDRLPRDLASVIDDMCF